MSINDSAEQGSESQIGSISIRAILAGVLVAAVAIHSIWNEDLRVILGRLAEIAVIWYFAQKKTTS